MGVSKEVLVQKLNDIEAVYTAWQATWESLDKMFGGDCFDGELGKVQDSFMQLAVELFCELSGITTEAVWWWIYGAEWGKGRCNGVGVNGTVDVELTSNREFIDWEISDVGS